MIIFNRATTGPGAAQVFFREHRAGFERYDGGSGAPRHGHVRSHISIVLETGYQQIGYGGRYRLQAGDILIQPTLDRHLSFTPGQRASRALHLPWLDEDGFGGVFSADRIDDVIRLAETDPREAVVCLSETMAAARLRERADEDWPDLLARALRRGPVALGDWSRRHRLCRETVARGFRQAYGISPRRFGCELRARGALLQILAGQGPLAQVAAGAGYADQAHMTRAVKSLTGATPLAWRRSSTQAEKEVGPCDER